MRLRSLGFVALLATSMAAVNCGGATIGASPDAGASSGGTDAPADGGVLPDGARAPAARPNPDAVGSTVASRVDILFAVDNSASMADKQTILSRSVGTLLRRVALAGDVHLGVITSSLGTLGGDVCDDSGATNTRAHLGTRGPAGPVASAAQGFLSYGPGGTTDVEAFVADAAKLIDGVGQNGCGLEAQLESAYRFLVQPDPWATVTINGTGQADYDGLDVDLLAQRKAFLRPDSLVVVVMLTDEDDSSADPRSVGGQGWAFESNQFPGSTVFRVDGKSTTAPRPSSACASNPGSPGCTSCGFVATCDTADAACRALRSDPACLVNGGYLGPTEDSLNIRFQRMKQRYGIDPQFPLARYVDGFTKQRAPNRDGEHIVQGRDYSAYVGDGNCTNPLFAASLPGTAGDELCALPQGPRGKELVVFTVIGGVPEALAGANPSWTTILGADPDAYDLSGQDPHMIQSSVPRAGLVGSTQTRGDNGTDPVQGREWDTGGNDLQFACTFALPAPRTCTAADASCRCADSNSVPPLCSATFGEQTMAQAYPTIRELRLAKALGDQGVIGSICPTDAAQGYTATMTRLADRLASRIR